MILKKSLFQNSCTQSAAVFSIVPKAPPFKWYACGCTFNRQAQCSSCTCLWFQLDPMKKSSVKFHRGFLNVPRGTFSFYPSMPDMVRTLLLSIRVPYTPEGESPVEEALQDFLRRPLNIAASSVCHIRPDHNHR